MSEYVDYAEYYDFDHDRAFDLEFYLDYARECGSPVLELACGTGRLLVSLAEAGFEMYGFDLTESMLAVCLRKVEERGLAGRVHLAGADMVSFDMPRRDFALAFVAFRSFMHLYTQADQMACLERVYQHLRPGGLFIVDVYAPVFWMLARAEDGPFAEASDFWLPNGHRVVRKVRFVRNDPARQIVYHELRFEEYDSQGVLVRQHTMPYDTRYTFRYELTLLLERAGFEVTDLFRDYKKNPFDGTDEIIAVARRPT
jgi:SAM-dependent methyltransferase